MTTRRTAVLSAELFTTSHANIQCTKYYSMLVAQLLVHWTFNQVVAGSIPSSGEIKSPRSNSTQPSIPPGKVNRVPALVAVVKTGVFTCVGWQVTLCDPIWHVTPCSSEMGFHHRTYHLAYFKDKQ